MTRSCPRSRQRGFFLHNYDTPAPDNATVVLLAHMDGANGSTSFVDSSPYARALTGQGSPAISTAQSKFGGSSLLLPGNSRVYAAGADELQLSTYWTMEAFVYPTAGSGTFRNVLTKHTANGDDNWQFLISNDNRLSFYPGDGGGGERKGTSTIPLNAWTFVAVSMASGTLRLFVDGVLEATHTGVTVAPLQLGSQLNIGSLGAREQSLTGYLDEIRFTNGATSDNCRYTASFTPPAAAFPNP